MMDKLTADLDARERARARADSVRRAIRRLSGRELCLVREAALMGFVQGARQVDSADIPPDSEIIIRTLDAVPASSDLFPTLAELFEEKS